MPRRRVLLYSDGAVFGGGERYIVEVARGLPKDRYAPEVVTSHEGAVDAFAAEVSALGVPVRRLPRVLTLSNKRAFLKLLKFFGTTRPDILHFNLVDPRACSAAMLAAYATGHRRIVAIEHLPRSPFDSKKPPFRHRFTQKRVKVTIVNTEVDKSAVENRPRNRGRVVIIPNGIPDTGKNSETRRASARAALGFPDHVGPLVYWVGRFIEQKNPDLFIEGVRRVAASEVDARFVMIGDGPNIEAIRGKVGVLGLTHLVRFFGHRPDARELIYGADLLVNTSRYEGMPFTILEAMCASVPVLGQAIPEFSELIARGVSGQVVAPENGDVLGRELIHLLGQLGRLREMGRVGRERMLSLYSLDAMCRRTAEVYDSL